LPDKREGYAWGPDLPNGDHLLLATNDNDFAQPTLNPGFPDYIFAFEVSKDDPLVAGFQQETFVPEPASVAFIGIIGFGFGTARRRRLA
jgi:hypothetical protein